MQMRFGVLGPLEVWCAEQRMPTAGARHRRVLGMLLLAANQVVPVDRLVAAGWDERPPATAARQVRKIVANFRHLLPGGPALIVTEDPGYRIVLATSQLDLTQFNAAIARARQASPPDAVDELRFALTLWRGPVLAGSRGRVLDSIAVGLDERRLTAAERLLGLRLGLGEAREIVDELRELAVQHPARESVRGMLMMALYRSARQADAIGEYTALRQYLAEELGIGPSRELAALYEQILHNSPELDSAPADPESKEPLTVTVPTPRSLPYDLPDFVGRAAELRSLLAAGRKPSDGAGILAIDGMGGCGKTSLAVHAAHLLAPHYPDGQMFVDLHGFTAGMTPIHPSEALDILLTGVGVIHEHMPGTVAGRSALWRTMTATRRMLIVLDNAVDSVQVQSLLPGASSNLALVTSRSYLGGLDGAFAVSLGLLGEEDSLKLLADTISEERLAAEPTAAAALVRLCGRLPIALRIAATRLRSRPQWSIRYFVSRLHDAQTQLGELITEERSVAATIGLSYDVMKPGQQELFRLLGVLPCDFDAYAAAAVIARPLTETGKLLEQMLDAHVLEPVGHGRYAAHDLVRGYAMTLMPDPQDPELMSARRRMLNYYTHVAEIAGSQLRDAGATTHARLYGRPADIPRITDAQAALDWFDSERRQLAVMAATAASAGLLDHAARLSRSLDGYQLGLSTATAVRGQYPSYPTQAAGYPRESAPPQEITK